MSRRVQGDYPVLACITARDSLSTIRDLLDLAVVPKLYLPRPRAMVNAGPTRPYVLCLVLYLARVNHMNTPREAPVPVLDYEPLYTARDGSNLMMGMIAGLSIIVIDYVLHLLRGAQ